MITFLSQWLLRPSRSLRRVFFSNYYREKISQLLLLLILLSGCVSGSRTHEKSDNSKYLIVTERCAVIYWPSSAKIRKAKRKGKGKGKGKEDFYTASDDVVFYIATSREFLEEHGIKVIETEADQIEFHNGERCIEKMDLSSEERMWGIVLFNGVDRPKEADILDVKSDFRAYMK